MAPRPSPRGRVRRGARRPSGRRLRRRPARAARARRPRLPPAARRAHPRAARRRSAAVLSAEMRASLLAWPGSRCTKPVRPSSDAAPTPSRSAGSRRSRAPVAGTRRRSLRSTRSWFAPRASRSPAVAAGAQGEPDDLATQAADDALMAIMRKLHTYRGDSRFTTWAYKFALLEAAVKVRKRAWHGREVPLEADGWAQLADRRACARPRRRECRVDRGRAATASPRGSPRISARCSSRSP